MQVRRSRQLFWTLQAKYFEVFGTLFVQNTACPHPLGPTWHHMGHKVRKTSKTQTKSNKEAKVEFAHLIDDPEIAPDDVMTTVEDEQMDDALSFITSDSEGQGKKRRRVRRKKSND